MTHAVGKVNHKQHFPGSYDQTMTVGTAPVLQAVSAVRQCRANCKIGSMLSNRAVAKAGGTQFEHRRYRTAVPVAQRTAIPCYHTVVRDSALLIAPPTRTFIWEHKHV
jgi:hypothetical protein